MALGIEDRPAVSDVHVVPRRGRHVRVLGQAALVDALRGLDDLVQARRDLGRGHAAAEDVAGGDCSIDSGEMNSVGGGGSGESRSFIVEGSFGLAVVALFVLLGTASGSGVRMRTRAGGVSGSELSSTTGPSCAFVDAALSPRGTIGRATDMRIWDCAVAWRDIVGRSCATGR